jgi:hypothetical protein
MYFQDSKSNVHEVLPGCQNDRKQWVQVAIVDFYSNCIHSFNKGKTISLNYVKNWYVNTLDKTASAWHNQFKRTIVLIISCWGNCYFT